VHDSAKALDSLKERFDHVLVDAPCTGTGTWRRRPDTKWRLTERNLQERVSQQTEALTEASAFVKSGGSLVYVTCSVLPDENDRQVQAFCKANPAFEIVPVVEDWARLFGASAPKPRSADGKTVTLSPASMDTDGFFFCRMRRR
jgi:16S rRNA (cytosine967-C5)-methyltransferase